MAFIVHPSFSTEAPPRLNQDYRLGVNPQADLRSISHTTVRDLFPWIETQVNNLITRTRDDQYGSSFNLQSVGLILGEVRSYLRGIY